MEQKQIDQGIRLKNLIKALNLNQLSFSQSLGVAQPNISKMMNGERQISMEVLHRISERHNVNLHWLLTGRGEMFFDGGEDESPQVKEDQAVYGGDRMAVLEARLALLEKEFKRWRKGVEK